MGKTEILKIMSRATGYSRDVCANALDAFRDAIVEALVAEDKVLLPRFMSFEIIERSERETFDFQTDSKKTYPPVKIVKCKMSKEIRDIINGKMRG